VQKLAHRHKPGPLRTRQARFVPLSQTHSQQIIDWLCASAICFARCSGGLVRDGKLLMDFHSFLLRITEVTNQPQEAILKFGFSDGLYGRSNGGQASSSWSYEHLPYLMELDNWGARNSRGNPGRAVSGSRVTTKSHGLPISRSSTAVIG
jgi:hypothetical protein